MNREYVKKGGLKQLQKFSAEKARKNHLYMLLSSKDCIEYHESALAISVYKIVIGCVVSMMVTVGPVGDKVTFTISEPVFTVLPSTLATSTI